MMPGGMMDQNAIEWRPTCDKDGCIGVRLPQVPSAWPMPAMSSGTRHSSDSARPARSTRVACPSPRVSWSRSLPRAPRNAEGRPTFMAADFQAATFQGDAQFNKVTF